MKRIILSCLIIALFGTLTAACSERGETMKFEVTIGAIDPDDLPAADVAVEILNNRVKDLMSSKKAGLQGTEDRYVYTVEVTTRLSEANVIDLLSRRGEIGFWETYQWNELDQLREHITIVKEAVDYAPGESALTWLLPNVATYITEAAVLYYIPEENIADVLTLGGLRGRDYLPSRAVVAQSRSKLRPDGTVSRDIYLLKGSSSDNGPAIDGRYIDKAKLSYSRQDPYPYVGIWMNDEGAMIWEQITRDNAHRQLTITLDDEVVSSPVVMHAITGGRSSISGIHDVDEMRVWAILLSHEVLPIDVSVRRIHE